MLRIRQDNWAGEIALDNGRVVGAVFGPERGLAALDALVVVLPRGALDFSPDCQDVERNIELAPSDLREHVAPAVISARFHAGLAEATVDVIERIARTCGPLPVALSGGCFQNPLLAREVVSRLTPGRQVFLNRLVPPGDGGVALGQAMVAAAIAQRM